MDHQYQCYGILTYFRRTHTHIILCRILVKMCKRAIEADEPAVDGTRAGLEHKSVS